MSEWLANNENYQGNTFKVPRVKLVLGSYLFYKKGFYVERTFITKITDGYVYVDGFEQRIDKKTLTSADMAFYPYSFQANGAVDDQLFHYF